MNGKRRLICVLLLAAVCAVLLTVGSAAAEDHGAVVDSGACGENLTWTLYEDGLLEISGTGAMENYDWGTVPWYFHRYYSRLKSLQLNEGITTIGEYAFYDCSDFTGSLTIPNSVTTIGNFAFCDCTGFTGSLTIPDSVKTIGVYAFAGCYGFTGSLTIPDSVTAIGYRAFCDCDGFTGSLTIGNSVTEVSPGAFAGCSGITDFKVSSGNQKYMAFNEVLYSADGSQLVSFPAGKKEIPAYHPNCTEIGESAFYDCDGLTDSLTIPDSVETIGDYAFYDCEGFTGSLTIPNSVTRIDRSAFYGCSGFTGSLMIPDSVTKVGTLAFMNCSGITDFKVSSENQVYSAFNGVLYSADGSKLVSFPAGKKEIPAYHPNCTEIGEYAFYDCYGLTGSLTIPDSVTSIGDWAFSYCSGFTGSLTIPDSVTTIGDYVFWSCSGISEAFFLGDAPLSFGSGVFSGCADGFTIYYQNGKSGWTTPEWNGYPCYPYEGDPIPDDYLRGDVNNDGQKDSDDAIYLLRHTLNAARYPINQSGDMDGDNDTDSDDAIYLLRHTLNESRYPLR